MKRSIWLFKVYAILALLILTVTMVWPHIYTVEGYEEKVAEGMITNIYGRRQDIVGKMRRWAKRLPDATIKIDGYVLSFDGLPIWRVVLDAPQYPRSSFPKGIVVNVFFTGPKNACKNTECLHEIDTLNHWVGMEPTTSVAPIEKKVAPFSYILFAVMVIMFILSSRRIYGWLLLVPILLPLLYALDYSFWNHWLGYNLHEWASFKIRPFTPMVFGVGKVAQFTVRMHPAVGFFLLLISSALFFLAYMSKKKGVYGDDMEILLEIRRQRKQG